MKPLTSASNWQGWRWIVLQLLSNGDAQHMGQTCCRASSEYRVQRNGLNKNAICDFLWNCWSTLTRHDCFTQQRPFVLLFSNLIFHEKASVYGTNTSSSGV